AQRTAVGLVGNDGRVDGSRIEALAGVAQVIHVTQPYKQVSREWRPENTIVTIAPGVSVGGNDVIVIAGPCSVESEEQIVTAARQVRAAGATCLRGGAFKPRSSPYSFQGLGLRGLELLALARKETGLAIVTEAMDEEGAELVAEYGDCIQIGARNMLDLTAIPIVQGLSHLPIIADPSHGTGIRDKVIPMARAAVAAGAHGILVEVHPNPERALSDGAQSLYPEQFAQLVRELRSIAGAIGRRLAPAPERTTATAHV